MIDSHAHLDSCADSIELLLGRARTAGVQRILTVGTDPASVDTAIDHAERHAEVFAAVGRHPHESAGFGSSDLEVIELAAQHAKVRAIGESGLDYYRDLAPRDDQRRAFIAQIELAARLELPLVLHTRAAEVETFELLAHYADAVTVIVHCFSAPDRLAECIERGYYCSFAGNVTYPKSTDLQEAVRHIPAERLLVETDSPYLAPQPMRGKPNEPANVCETARLVAELRQTDYRELEAQVQANAERLFRW